MHNSSNRNLRGLGAKQSTFHSLPSDDLCDEELVRRVQARQQESLKVLYRRYAPLVFHLASQSLDASTAEEIVQDVFLAIWRKADTFDPKRGKFRPWALQIAHFRILNELRHRSRRPQLNPNADEEFLEDLPDSNAEPIDAAWQTYRREAIQAAVNKLPPPQRQALSLAFFEELTQDQVANMLDLPLGTVKTRIRSGLQKIRANLMPLGIAVALIGILSILGIRYQMQRAELEQEANALQMVTMSDVTATHIPPAQGVPPEAHGSYRTRPGSSIAVLALHNFPQAPEGKVYQGWVLHQGTWISLGTTKPDPQGDGVLVGNNPALAASPEVIEVTLEPEGASARPMGPIMIILKNP